MNGSKQIRYESNFRDSKGTMMIQISERNLPQLVFSY